MSQEQAAILRDELEQTSRRRKRRRYPAELRDRASQYAREVRAAGGTLADAAEALGLRRATLRNWVLGRGAVVPARGLRRVEVRECVSAVCSGSREDSADGLPASPPHEDL